MEMRKGKIMELLLVACLSLVASSCVVKVDSVLANVDPRGLQNNQTCTVEYLNEDTLSLREIYVIMRTDVSMKRSAVEFDIRCIAPDSSVYDGKVRVVLDAKHGNGTSFNENEQLFCSDALLSKAGIYRFIFSHNYSAPLIGIRNIGVDIQPATNGKRQN